MDEKYARREFLRQAVAGGVSGIIPPTWLASGAGCQMNQTRSGQLPADEPDKPIQKGNTVMAYTLPNLPYGFDALEPYIDEQTMRIHHDKHHNAYVTNLNKALEGHPDLATKSVEELMLAVPKLPEDIKLAVRNNAGQHYNHSLYWEIMAPADKRGGMPADAAFIAMSLHQLGRAEEARAALARLRRLMQQDRWAEDEESQAFLHEAETLIEGRAATTQVAPVASTTQPATQPAPEPTEPAKD